VVLNVRAGELMGLDVRSEPAAVTARSMLTVAWPVLVGGAGFFLWRAGVGSSTWWLLGLLAVAGLATGFAAFRDRPAGVAAAAGLVPVGAGVALLGWQVVFPPLAERAGARLLGADIPARDLYAGWVLVVAAFVVGCLVARVGRTVSMRVLSSDWSALLVAAACVAAAPAVGGAVADVVHAQHAGHGLDHVIERSSPPVPLDLDTGAGALRTRPRSDLPLGTAVVKVGQVTVALGRTPDNEQYGLTARDGAGERWHYRLPLDLGSGAQIVGAAIGTVVAVLDDLAVLLDVTSGRELARVPFPALGQGFWRPLLTDDGFRPDSPGGPRESRLGLAVTNRMMAFVDRPEAGGAPAVVSFDTATRTFTTLDQPPAPGCSYLLSSTPGHTDAYLVRSRCGPTKIVEFGPDGRMADVTVPDDGGLPCALGCDLDGVLEAPGSSAIVVMQRRYEAGARADRNQPAPSTVEVVMISTDAGLNGVRWRRAFAGQDVPPGTPMADLGVVGQTARIAVGPQVLDRQTGQVLDAAEPSPLRVGVLSAQDDHHLYVADDTKVVRYGVADLRRIDEVDVGCQVDSLTYAGDGLLAYCAAHDRTGYYQVDRKYLWLVSA